VEKIQLTLRKKLAFEITKQLHGEQEAQSAADAFGKTVQNKELPDEIPLSFICSGTSMGRWTDS
jgi:tyrosyl-tRNA synthetase